MKTKIVLIAIIAITLLSFTLISTSRAPQKKATAKEQAKGSHTGFVLQDSNQF
jgi:hypothetical protein